VDLPNIIIYSGLCFLNIGTKFWGLSRDIKAVEKGINMPWSNGAVEGHVNRIKSIKWQMYGRASRD
jgi:transposase